MHGLAPRIAAYAQKTTSLNNWAFWFAQLIYVKAWSLLFPVFALTLLARNLKKKRVLHVEKRVVAIQKKVCLNKKGFVLKGRGGLVSRFFFILPYLMPQCRVILM